MGIRYSLSIRPEMVSKVIALLTPSQAVLTNNQQERIEEAEFYSTQQF